MKYRVVFRERSKSRTAPPENPIAFLQSGHSREIIRRAVFLLRKDSDVKSSGAEPLTEDEQFLRLGTQTWEYEVAEGKDQEFKDALLNSGCMVEFTSI